MREKKLGLKEEAAAKFAAQIQKLAEDGNIISLSITIQTCSSDELFKLAKILEIKELSVTAQIGA